MVAIMLGADNGFFYAGQVMHFSGPFTVFLIYHKHPYGLNGLLFELLSKKEYKEITDYIEEKMRNRIKPNFGDDSHAYFQRLIDEEKRKLSSMLGEPNM